MIEIVEFQNDTCELFDPSGNFIGIIKSQNSFLKVLMDICIADVYGYYIIFNDKKHVINRYGAFGVNYPHGLYDTIYSEKLLRTQLDKRKRERGNK